MPVVVVPWLDERAATWRRMHPCQRFPLAFALIDAWASTDEHHASCACARCLPF